MPPAESERLGELLIEEGVVTQEEIQRAIAEGGMKGTILASVLESVPHARRADLAAFLASDFRIPVLEDLRKVDLPRDAARLIPEELARRHEMVPLALMGNLLCVAKPNYLNRAAVQELRRLHPYKVKVLQADEEQVLAALDKLYKGKKGELPPPRAARRRVETTVLRATPPPVEEEAAFEAIPLISMPEEEGGAAAPAAAAVPSAARNETLEDVVEILDAVRVPAEEYASALRNPFIKLVVDFDEFFRVGKVVPPYRVL